MTGVNYSKFEEVMKEIEELSKRKNHDYGCDSLTRFGNFGIMVIMLQKMDRLKTFYDKDGKLKVDDEKLEDTLKDIVNYAIYMILQERKQLVDEKPEPYRHS
jgi:hypothetical protein